MAIINPGRNLVKRLEAGASILAAARTVDTQLIKERLAAFKCAHGDYKQAHDEVARTEARVLAAQTVLKGSGAAQNKAIEATARALVTDGLPRANPFEPYGLLTAGGLLRLRVEVAAKAVHELVGAIRLDDQRGAAVLRAVQQLDQAAVAVEKGLARIVALKASVREARHKRDAAGTIWKTEVAALKRAARAAADQGAPLLYATLFERPNKSKSKAAKPAPGTQPAPATQPAPETQPAQNPSS